jgi:D-serine deaminase-like pyridoxal phosphate-dependent protein
MNSLYEQYVSSLSNINSPALFVDVDAFEENIQWVLQNAGTKKIRIATKSLRSVELIKKILDSSDQFQGLMTFTLEEALWLRSQGFKDILMGYPTLDKKGLQELAKNPAEITLMVDLIEHLDALEELAKKNKNHLRICFDIDLSLDLPGLRFGVYRSSLNSRMKVKALLEKLTSYPHLKLVGVMGYEAQIAGVMDKNLPLIKVLKNLSLKQLKIRRHNIVDLVESYGHKLEFVNGGGTGSLLETTQEECVTEVTIGSAFYAPVLFDHYEDFTLTPSMYFTLPIVRHPDKHIFTCTAGGYIASGSLEPVKLPTPVLPLGLKLLKHEGAGEVQTPMNYTGSYPLKVGDIVIMRYAKAGEVCERFDKIHLIRKNSYIGSTQTYRGEGKTFL